MLRRLVVVSICMAGVGLPTGFLVPARQAAWAQDYIAIPYEDEVNIDRFRDLATRPNYRELFVPQSQESCPTSTARLWIEQDPTVGRFVRECLPEMEWKNAGALIKWAGLLAGMGFGATAPAAAPVFLAEISDSAAQCVANLLAETWPTQGGKEKIRYAIKAFFELKDWKELTDAFTDTPNTRLETLKNAFDKFSGIPERPLGVYELGSQLPPWDAGEMGILASPQEELDSAKALAERCEFAKADAALVRATDWQKQTIRSAMSRYRKNERHLYCFRQLTKRRLSEDAPYAIPSSLAQQWRYGEKRAELDSAASAIRRSFGVLDQTDAMWKSIQEKRATLQVKRRFYETLLLRGDAAWGARDLPDACEYVGRLKEELRPWNPTCRSALLDTPSPLRSPAAYVNDLEVAFENQRGHILGLLRGVDHSLIACRPDDVRAVLQTLPNELKKLVKYLPTDSSESRPDTILGSDGKCGIPEREHVAMSLQTQDYWRWLSDIEKTAKDAEASLSTAARDAQDRCRFEDALTSQGGEVRLASRIQQGCLKDGAERLTRIKTEMAQRSAAVRQALETVETTTKQIPDLIDLKAEPAHCAVEEAGRLLDDALRAAEQLRCPSDSSPPPSPTAAARWQRVHPTIEELEGRRQTVTELAQKIDSVLAGLAETARTVTAEPNCQKAEDRLDRQRKTSAEILKCREYSQQVTDGLAAIATVITGKRTEAGRKAAAATTQGRGSLDRCDGSLSGSLATLNALRRGPTRSCLEPAGLGALDALAGDLDGKIAELRSCQARVNQTLAAIEADLAVCKLDGIEALIRQAEQAMPGAPCPSNHPEFAKYTARIGNIGSRVALLKQNIGEYRNTTLVALERAEKHVENWNHQIKVDDARKEQYQRSIAALREPLRRLEDSPELAVCLSDLLQRMRAVMAQTLPPPVGETPTNSVDRAVALAGLDCNKLYPGSVAVWSEKEQRAGCVCPDPPGWNADKTACNVDRETALAALDCHRLYPGSVAVWSEQKQRAGCVCPDPPGWNADKTACNKPRTAMAETVNCEGTYPGSVAVWDEEKQMHVCRCVAPRTWNAAHTACVGGIADKSQAVQETRPNQRQQDPFNEELWRIAEQAIQQALAPSTPQATGRDPRLQTSQPPPGPPTTTASPTTTPPTVRGQVPPKTATTDTPRAQPQPTQVFEAERKALENQIRIARDRWSKHFCDPAKSIQWCNFSPNQTAEDLIFRLTNASSTREHLTSMSRLLSCCDSCMMAVSGPNLQGLGPCKSRCLGQVAPNQGGSTGFGFK